MSSFAKNNNVFNDFNALNGLNEETLNNKITVSVRESALGVCRLMIVFVAKNT